MSKIKNIIVALGVFTMMIGSGFAMDNNPPTEPVKVVFETEVVADAPMQAPYTGKIAYMDSSFNCIEVENFNHCTTVNTGIECQISISGQLYYLYTYVENPITNVWECKDPLYALLHSIK